MSTRRTLIVHELLAFLVAILTVMGDLLAFEIYVLVSVLVLHGDSV
jgi:hypothetical protein